MPLPGSKVIHPKFEAHHRPVAEGAMTGTGTVSRYSSSKTWDEEAGKSVYQDPTVVHGPGPVRVQRQSSAERPATVGERQVIVRTYTVGFPADVPELRIGDQITVTDVADTQLPDQKLWIHDVYYGSLVWERDVVAQNAPPVQR